MDIGSIASSSSAVCQAQTGDAVAIAVFRRALDIETQGALQLIQALPQPATISSPNLGQGVNTFA